MAAESKIIVEACKRYAAAKSDSLERMTLIFSTLWALPLVFFICLAALYIYRKAIRQP